jgi:hypothetical protein
MRMGTKNAEMFTMALWDQPHTSRYGASPHAGTMPLAFMLVKVIVCRLRSGEPISARRMGFYGPETENPPSVIWERVWFDQADPVTYTFMNIFRFLSYLFLFRNKSAKNQCLVVRFLWIRPI